MPTKEERREVAARLREKHGERQGTLEPRSMYIQAMNRLDDLLDCLPKRRDMLLDLADLIEPEPERTCELTAFADVPFSVDYEVEGYDSSSGRDYAALAECSKCGGYAIIPPAYHHVLTCDGDEVYQECRYCPSCGARVAEVSE